MRVVLTLMVRDEADIIAATLEHHLAEGVDHIVVTDNGSVDGTREILAEYEQVAPITIFDDPLHAMQQGRNVTRMARFAADELGADWVINGDADEFVRAVDRSLTLHDALEHIPTDLGAFTVEVTNYVGPLARRGSGIRRLLHLDRRSEAQLRTAGLLSHPTSNTIHVGSSDVSVAEGNHTTSIEPRGEVPAAFALEVVHLPWRSVAQIHRKTRNQGSGFDASPELNPSPQHHGMRDWRRLKGGILDAFLALRTPTMDELGGPAFEFDSSFRDHMEELKERALLPSRYAAAIDDRDDEIMSDEEVLRLRSVAVAVQDVEQELYLEIAAQRAKIEDLESQRGTLQGELAAERQRAARELDAVRAELAALEQRHSALEQSRNELEHEAAQLRSRIERIERHPAIRVGLLARRALLRVRRR